MRRENRQYPRSRMSWRVTMKTSNGIMEGQIRDISSGGAFIYCEKPLTPNQTFYLSIHIYPRLASLTSKAEAVWSTASGMGIRFRPLRPQQPQLLSKFILTN